MHYVRVLPWRLTAFTVAYRSFVSPLPVSPVKTVAIERADFRRVDDLPGSYFVSAFASLGATLLEWWRLERSSGRAPAAFLFVLAAGQLRYREMLAVGADISVIFLDNPASYVGSIFSGTFHLRSSWRSTVEVRICRASQNQNLSAKAPNPNRYPMQWGSLRKTMPVAAMAVFRAQIRVCFPAMMTATQLSL